MHIGRLVDAVLDLERDSASARGVTIVRDVGADGCVAVGDAEKLKQVVINLVVNALEANEGRRGSSRCACSPTGPTACA